MESTVDKNNGRNFEVKEILKEILISLVLFCICATGFSAFTDLEEFKKDCANPITKECSSNIIYNTFFIGIPQIFGYEVNNKSIENKSQ